MKKRTQIILWLLCVAWLIILVFLSTENGVATQRRSRELAKWIVPLLQMAKSEIPRVDRFLRTMAHFSGFFILGGLVYSAVRGTFAKLQYSWLFCAGLCSLFGVLDEAKKMLISGRHLHWSDVGLNVLGACCGVIVSVLIMKYIKSPEPTPENPSTQKMKCDICVTQHKDIGNT